MNDYLLTISSEHSLLVYFLIILFAIIEGPILSMFLGALLFAGYFSFIPVYISLMLGDLLGDVIWYYAGYHYGLGFITRFGEHFNITEEHILKVKQMFHQYKNRIIFFSKISGGLGFAIVTLFTAGLSRVPFWRYMVVNFFGQILWSGMLVAVGFFFSNIYLRIDSWLGRIMLLITGLVVVVLIYLYSKSYGKKISKDGKLR